MKSKFLIFMFVTVSLMTVACDKKQKNNVEPVESDSKEVKAANMQPAQDDEAVAQEENSDAIDHSGIVSIKKAWADKTIKVESGKSAPGIEQFAKAFCKTYPQWEANTVLRDYLQSPKDYKNEMYSIQSYPSDGFIRCEMATEVTNITHTCFWNRKNGHQLFAVYMDAGTESGEWQENAVLFYDYNPDTGMMTPELVISSMIEDRVNKYDSYSVVLPQKGKDIEIKGYTINKEEDNCDVYALPLKWNGMSFEWVDLM